METAKVLIVEDDPDVRAALTRALTFEGYDVATATDGGRGLEAVVADSPDVIVLDVMMPFVDGLEMCRRLRAKGDATPASASAPPQAAASKPKASTIGMTTLRFISISVRCGISRGSTSSQTEEPEASLSDK